MSEWELTEAIALARALEDQRANELSDLEASIAAHKELLAF